MKLRWKLQRNTPHARPVLQFWQQNPRASECAGIDYSQDGEWVDVPTELVDREPDERMSCCDGGPQWGHAWKCPNAT
jgi:hypothetical protein